MQFLFCFVAKLMLANPPRNGLIGSWPMGQCTGHGHPWPSMANGWSMIYGGRGDDAPLAMAMAHRPRSTTRTPGPWAMAWRRANRDRRIRNGIRIAKCRTEKT